MKVGNRYLIDFLACFYENVFEDFNKHVCRLHIGMILGASHSMQFRTNKRFSHGATLRIAKNDAVALRDILMVKYANGGVYTKA